MDYKQLKTDVKSLLKANRSGIRKAMWKVLSVCWVFILAYSLIIFFTLSKDINNTQPSYYVISYLLGFITAPLMFVFNVCFFRALYFCLPGEAFPGSKAAGSFLNAAFIIRCIVLGVLQHILSIPSTLSKLIPLIQPDGDSTMQLLGSIYLIQLAVMVFSAIFFSVFLPCFVAQGLSILESFKSSVRLVLRFSNFIRFSLRVILPAAILVTPVFLLCLSPLFLFEDYLGKLYFMVIFGALFPVLVNTILYGLWMRAPYICLCIMEYVDINQCVLQLSEDVVEEYSDEDFEQRMEKLINLQRARENMHRPSIAAGKSVCIGLKNDGTVLAFDMVKRKEYILDKWTDVREVAAGGDKIFGIRGDGTVVMTDIGHINNVTELKGETEEDDACLWQNIVEIGAGDEHIAALTGSGKVLAAGDNKYDQCEVQKWKDITNIAVGSWHTVGVKKDGTVAAEGLNEDGQCNVLKWTDIYRAAAGDWHTVGLKNNGYVVAAGLFENDQCNVSKWTDITAVSCGKNYTLGLMLDGTVVAAGDSDGLCNVSGWTDIAAISAGDDAAAGLKSNGTVVFTKIGSTEDIGFPLWTDIWVKNYAL